MTHAADDDPPDAPSDGAPRPGLALAARTRSGLTQRGFADLLGVNRVTVARWESGSRPPGPVATALLTVIEAMPAEVVTALRRASSEPLPH